MKLHHFLFPIGISFLLVSFVYAVAIQIRPSQIKIEAEFGVLVKKEIFLENPTDKITLYEVYSDEFSEWVKITPASFTLESGEKKKVILELQKNEEGIFSTMISVIAKPLSQREFKTAAGVKIPLEIKISQKEFFLAQLSKNLGSLFSKNIFSLFGIMIIGSAIFILLCVSQKKRKKATEDNYYNFPIFKTSQRS